MVEQQSSDWISAEEALERAASSINDEWKAMRRLRELATTNEIHTRGVIDGQLIALDRLFWTNWKTEDGQWGAREDWTNGRFEGRILNQEGRTPTVIVGASKVQFSDVDMHRLFPDAAKRPRRKRGRSPSHAWPAFAEELALTVLEEYERRLPVGPEELIDRVFERMAARGKEQPGRTTIQSAVEGVLARLRKRVSGNSGISG